MRRVLPAILVAGAIATSVATGGCLDPYRVRVEHDILIQANGWVEVPGPVRGGGFKEAKEQETRYTFDPDSNNPPFPGTLQVFSVRRWDVLSDAELFRAAQQTVEEAAEVHGVQLDGAVREGHRTLDGGVRTQWILRSGTIPGADPQALFDEQVRINILAEVGHDGKSDTSFVAVAIVQVERAQQCPLNACAPIRSEASWIQVVGDPDGSIEGATSDRGFIDHLETH